MARMMMLGLGLGLAAVAHAEDGGTPTIQSRIKGAYFGTLSADALALSTHYEYDATKIKKFYGQIDRYYAPGEKTGGETHGVGWGQRNFHNGNGNGPSKSAGEQTDYGDYTILILEHLAATAKPTPHRIDLAELIPRWQDSMTRWRSWMCTMTKSTLQQVARGTPHAQLGGRSNAMALRAAAAYGYFTQEEDVVHAFRTAMFTHRDQSALDGGEFFARVTWRIVHGGGKVAPRAAIEEVAALPSSSPFIKQKVAQALAKVDEAVDPGSPLSREEYVDDLAITSMARLWDVGKTEPIKVGKASPTEGTLPGSIYFIVKYADDFAAAATANTMVGGDTASRAVAIGMVMGAMHGVEGIPEPLRDNLVEFAASDRLLDQLPLLAVDKGKHAEL